MQRIATICPYCGTGCGLVLTVDNNRIISAKGDPTHPVNQGRLCLKGYYGYHHVADERRLAHPLIRKDGLVPVNWDEALDFAAERLLEVRERYGPDAFALFSSARAMNEDNYAAQKFARAVMRTNNVDHCARL
jgi:Uncharacterized anaerobic dehydrogenase